METPEPHDYRSMAERCRELAAAPGRWSPEAREHLLKIAAGFEQSAQVLECRTIEIVPAAAKRRAR